MHPAEAVAASFIFSLLVDGLLIPPPPPPPPPPQESHSLPINTLAAPTLVRKKIEMREKAAAAAVSA